ncbi:hypothetical protein JL193_16575 [Polaribacter batillariae]|uniref:Phage protein n=1 Tax=Polaribacter batillariae TaxID=2808900 RepID=A0ABX7STT2_9FLAO|nr:hypothetical protein [Polaribacter batillariae]QTD37657.1 hypothetical protein JL193_16575 [Polaribacter batillariae]
MKINMAYYRKKDWKKFLKIIDDRDSMYDFWEDWHKSYLNAKRSLTSKGFIVNDYVVDLGKLKTYCKIRGLKIDGKARSQFVSEVK